MTGHAYGLLAWWRFPSVAPVLRNLDLGSSEQDGTQRLVIDRTERRAYFADAAEARAFLRDQWPVEEPVELTTEQWQGIVDEVRQRMLARPLPSMEQLLRQMQEHSLVVSAVVSWLSKHAE